MYIVIWNVRMSNESAQICCTPPVSQISAPWVTITRLIWWRSCSPWWPETHTVLRSVERGHDDCYHRHSSGRRSCLSALSHFCQPCPPAGSGVLCSMCSGYKGRVQRRQREAQPGVEQFLPLPRHLPAAASQQDPAGLVRQTAVYLCVCQSICWRAFTGVWLH